MFPKFHNPRTAAELDDLRHLLSNQRQAQRLRPIPMHQPLQLLRRCHDPASPTVDPDLQLPPPAPKSPIPAKYAPALRDRIEFSSDGCNNLELSLTDAIQTGEGHLSQVFRGQYRAISGPTATVVVKLFQQSLYDPPGDFDFVSIPDGFYGDWQPGTRLAQTEAWAYEQLTDLHGSVVPHSYGFYIVALPNEEQVIGHVLEELEGKTYREAVAALENPRDFNPLSVEALMDATLWAFHAIHCRGVTQEDVAARNMHVLLSETSVSVVLFDFALARRTYGCSGEYNIFYEGRKITNRAFREGGISKETVQQWVHAHGTSIHKPDWMLMFYDYEDRVSRFP